MNLRTREGAGRRDDHLEGDAGSDEGADRPKNRRLPRSCRSRRRIREAAVGDRTCAAVRRVIRRCTTAAGEGVDDGGTDDSGCISDQNTSRCDDDGDARLWPTYLTGCIVVAVTLNRLRDELGQRYHPKVNAILWREPIPS